MSGIDLLCAGNALVDVFADVSGALLGDIRERFGLDRPVQHVSAETASAVLEALREAASTVISSGGGAANTAKMAAALGLKAAFTGCVGAGAGGGADVFGAFFEDELSGAGVAPLLRKVDKPTGVFINIAAPGDTVIAASPSAALELGADGLPGFAPDNKPKIIMFEGFLMNRPALIRRCLELAGQCGAILAFDAGTADIAGHYSADILGWYAGLASGGFSRESAEARKDGQNEQVRLVRLVLFVNEAEAQALAAHSGNAPDWETLFLGLSAKAAGLRAAVKLAERGAVVFAGGKAYRVETRPVAGAECTGAGDAFAAGFLAALLAGKGPAECGVAGNAAASLVLKAPGAGIP